MNLVPTDEVPGPPPGPGVRTPFAAPPTERDRKRLWIGLGVGLGVLVLCCGGGVFGFGALVYSQSRAIPREAVAVVDEYLHDIQQGAYREAYDQLCRAHQQAEPLPEFIDRQRTDNVISDYQIGQPRVGASEVLVPAVIDRTGGGYDHRDFILIEDQQAGGLRICGGE